MEGSGVHIWHPLADLQNRDIVIQLSPGTMILYSFSVLIRIDSKLLESLFYKRKRLNCSIRLDWFHSDIRIVGNARNGGIP